MADLREQMQAALAAVVDECTGEPLRTVTVQDADGDGTVRVQVELGYPCGGREAAILDAVRTACAPLIAPEKLAVAVSHRIVAHAVQPGVALLPEVKNVIAVASGKGGVGKSSTAVNLALALAQQGAQVGLLDADIYGPSVPQMLGIAGERPKSEDGQTLLPLQAHGVQAMSIGFLVDVESPMVWRGPMATQALNQLLNDTAWRALDYLIIDLPPGTGDIQLTLAQRVPLTGAVIVTTPQDIALLDARKGLKMFEKVNVPILGVVENMSLHVCSHCGHTETIFGEGGGERLCADYGVPFLGKLPLDIRIRLGLDAGQPSVVAEPQGEIARHYQQIARAVAVAIARKAPDHSHKFPKIVVQNP